MNEQQTIFTIITAITLILSGTIAGYMTNKYAVRWLFKPVKLFGKQIFDVSILSTDEKQESFIESLSDCVERRILTEDILKKEIINETMRAHIDEITDYFIITALPDSLKNVTLSELPGFEQANSSLAKCLSDVLDKNTDALLLHVLSSINVSEFINEEQIQTASDNLYESLKHAFKYNPEIKSLVAGLVPELLFASMFNPEGRAALGKLASKLFSGSLDAQLGDSESFNFSEKISLTLKKLITKGVSGLVENKSVSEYINSEQRKSLADRLEKEILLKYSEKAEKLSKESVSPLLSRFSDNEKIRRTVSDIIYDYLEKNINRLLGGRVKETVKIALGRLNPDQLCDVAERLMKGELKYLSYFGGAIGFLLSIPALFITLGEFSSTGFPTNPLSLVFLICLMGFIGIITNVIAIKMFFHPYKKIKILSEFRHTKCFSQGLILQNQRIFAHTLGEYIGLELLTGENILKMLEAHKDSFINTLVESLTPTLLEYFKSEANRSRSAAKASALIFNKLAENREHISIQLCENLGERTFGSFVNLENPSVKEKALKLYSMLLEKLSKAPPQPDDEAYDYKFIAYALSSLIKDNPSMYSKVWAIFEAFYNSELKDKRILSYLSMSEFAKSTSTTIVKICSDNAAFNDFRKAVDYCISIVVANSEKYLSDEFTRAISLKCANAVYASAVKAIPELIKDVHISKITEEKVAGLEPEEIQNVVMSFASPAFKSLYKLGSIGGVFGLNTYLVFIVFIADKLFDKSK